MSGFKLGAMTFGSLFKKPETLLYPFETKEPPAGLKGQVTIEVSSCILCGMCQKTCPCDAITVSKPDCTWTIDRFLCVQCGSCVRACPKKCLTMNPQAPKPAAQKSLATYTVPESVPKPTKNKATKSSSAA